MCSKLKDIVEKEGKNETLFLFYVDILDGCLNINDSKIIQILRDDFKFEMLLRNFNLKLQLRIRNIKNEVDKYVKIINLLILEYIIKLYEDNNDNVIIQIRNKFGKPKLKNRNYQFNISDENGMVCLCIGFNEFKKDNEIGIDLSNPIDIENFKLNKLEDFYKNDFKSIFSSNEINQLDKIFNKLNYDDRLLKLSQIWSIKESYCKYIGIGITSGMEKFQFNLIENKLQEINKINEINGDFLIKSRNIILNKIDYDYKPLQASFKIPDCKIICSVFGHYKKICLIKIDAEKIIKEFIYKK
ncbi:holo-[acyl-carrier-protein] synthase [Pichia californica]|uniref:holo-[acyl-carrier-protein] synthase n=1 Tax=Pichia californica TaxID=460514 RepID=A0A9P6WR68_9ASCO|nr:holo-[acyl-carrier-protein] synthase [[Candida] californica]